MEKYYYKTKGQEPDVECLSSCPFGDRPRSRTMAGSIDCQTCKNCYGWDSEKHWIKCIHFSKTITNEN